MESLHPFGVYFRESHQVPTDHHGAADMRRSSPVSGVKEGKRNSCENTQSRLHNKDPLSRRKDFAPALLEENHL